MPSNKILEQKKVIVEGLTDRIKNAKSGVFVDYKGISVADDTALRAELRKAGVEYEVVKNTLTRIACKEVGYDSLNDIFNGNTAMATSSDFTAPAKILCEYAKKNENFVIKAGFIDGDVIDAAGVQKLSEIPSVEGLIAKILGSVQSPLFGFARVIQAIIDKQSAGAEAPADTTAEA